jgi:hypothetical protein
MTLNTTNLGAQSPSPEGGKSLRIPIERTNNGGSGLRAFASAQPPLFASHLKRWASLRTDTMKHLTFPLLLCLGLSAAAQSPYAIPYPTVRDSYIALSKDPEARLSRVGEGWEIVDVRTGVNEGIWSFPPKSHPAFPTVVKRLVVEKDGDLYVAMDALCGASKAACDQLIQDIQKMNEEMVKEIKAKRAAAK